MKYAKDPKVRDVDVILCWYCGDEYKKVNLHRHTQRKHPEEKPSWKLRNITPISNFFKVCGHSFSVKISNFVWVRRRKSEKRRTEKWRTEKRWTTERTEFEGNFCRGLLLNWYNKLCLETQTNSVEHFWYFWSVSVY